MSTKNFLAYGDAETLFTELAAKLGLKVNLATLAEEFSTSKSYLAGQYVLRNGVFYKCINTHSAGPWDDADFVTSIISTELESAVGGGEVNTINTISLNGNNIPPDVNRNVALTVITETVNNLTNYYLKSETYTQAEVDAIVTALKNGRFIVTNALPSSDIDTTAIYMIPNPLDSNYKDEYINVDGTPSGWNKIGDTRIDLSDYITETDLNTALANYVTTSGVTTAVNNALADIVPSGTTSSNKLVNNSAMQSAITSNTGNVRGTLPGGKRLIVRCSMWTGFNGGMQVQGIGWVPLIIHSSDLWKFNYSGDNVGTYTKVANGELSQYITFVRSGDNYIFTNTGSETEAYGFSGGCYGHSVEDIPT